MTDSSTFTTGEHLTRDTESPLISDDIPVNVGEAERWVSLIAGGTLLVMGLRHRSWTGLTIAATAAGLLYRGTTGKCHVYDAINVDTAQIDRDGVHVEKAVTINRPASELFAFWRNFENLPKFMTHLASVKTIDNKRSLWVANAPAGQTVSWEAEIVSETEGTQIMWRSLAGAKVANAGSVRFDPAPNGRGTEVRVSLSYNPPAGSVGVVVAKLFGEEPSQQIEKDLFRFKQLMEAGEIPTTQGQPSGHSLKRRIKTALFPSAVSRQSEEPGTFEPSNGSYKARTLEAVTD